MIYHNNRGKWNEKKKRALEEEYFSTTKQKKKKFSFGKLLYTTAAAIIIVNLINAHQPKKQPESAANQNTHPVTIVQTVKNWYYDVLDDILNNSAKLNEKSLEASLERGKALEEYGRALEREKCIKLTIDRYKDYEKTAYSTEFASVIDKIRKNIPKSDLEFLLNNYQKIKMDEKYIPLLKGFSKQIELGKLAAIIQTESGWDAKSVSEGGAVGLMQIMEGSSREEEWNNRYDLKTNISAGIRIYEAKENALKAYLPPEKLKKKDAKAYNAALWEHFKMVNAAYNGGQAVVIRAIEMAVKENHKPGWKQEWKDVVPYLEKACDPFYYYPRSKAEEMKIHVDRITYHYHLYRIFFDVEEIISSNENFSLKEIIDALKPGVVK